MFFNDYADRRVASNPGPLPPCHALITIAVRNSGMAKGFITGHKSIASAKATVGKVPAIP